MVYSSLIKFIKNLLVFFFLFIIGFYIFHLFKRPFQNISLKKLNYLQKVYPEDLIMKTGAILIKPKLRKDQFMNFSRKKSKNTIRIGTFGDSFTHGDEVHSEASYPSHLQELFKKKLSSQKIEILNFGVGSHGFQQQFFIWEKYSKHYEIDYILYGPRGLYPDRDITFVKKFQGDTFFRFPKNRFILLGEKEIQILSIKGDAPSEQYRNYYSFLPSPIVLRYDKNPFQIWETYFSFFKKLENPFYYSDLPDYIESMMINTILLKKISKIYNKKILLFTDNKWFFENYQKVSNLYNLNFFDSFENRFLYNMFQHKSSLGNEFVANIYFNALIGKKKFNLNVFDCYFNQTDFIVFKKDFNLNNTRQIHIGTKNISIGEVRLNSPDHYYRKEGEGFFQNKQKKIKSFIGFSGSSTNDIGLMPYYPLQFELNNKNRIYIDLQGEKILLGRPKPLDTFGIFFNIYTDYIKRIDSNGLKSIYFSIDKLPLSLKKKLLLKHYKKIHLLIDDYILGELKLENKNNKEFNLVLKQKNKKKTFLMMGPIHFLKESHLPSFFTLHIHYLMKDGHILKSSIPEWSCRKKKWKYQLSVPNFEPLNLPIPYIK